MSVAVEEGRLPHLGRNAELECERLFARHAEDVRRYVLMVLRNRSDADDVVQQTFLKALRALRSGVRPQRPRPWLIAIAHNECRMHFRRASRRPFEVDLELAAEAVAAEEGSESVEAVRDALDQLAPKQRSALVLRELEGRSYAEIAQLLELSESAVETLLFRARRALREQLETAGSCEDAQALLAAGELDELSRRRLRAHTRTCRPCATLERRRRGRLAAAGRRLAGLLPVPSWLPSLFAGGAGGAKAVAVVAAAALATTGAVESSTSKAPPHAAKPARSVAHVVPPARHAPQHVAAVPVRRRRPAARHTRAVRPVAAHAVAPTAPAPAAQAPTVITTTQAPTVSPPPEEPKVAAPDEPSARPDGPTPPATSTEGAAQEPQPPPAQKPQPPTEESPPAEEPPAQQSPLPLPQLPSLPTLPSLPSPPSVDPPPVDPSTLVPESLPIPPPLPVTVPQPPLPLPVAPPQPPTPPKLTKP
jgi:RNA polymerase sigma factor (sigma-70 family)